MWTLTVGRFLSALALICSFQAAHAAVSVTITASVTNAVFTVTGTGCAPGGYTTPQILQWGPGSSCTVAFVSPYSQQAGTQYVLTGWQDGSTSNPRVIVTPAQSTTYTASFKTQYQLSVNVNPPAGGSVSGGGFVDVGGTATLTATAATGYRFVNWSGSITTTANPTSVQMYNFQTVTANFLPVTNAVPGNWSVMQIATNATGWSINSFGQVAGGNVGNPFLWSPVSANSGVGTLMNLSNSTNLPTAAAVNDFGQVLFSQTSCCYGSAALWTPATAQGLTGTTTSISTESGNVVNTLNNFGQVGAFVNASPSIWTPTTPNGTSGAYTANPQWGGLTATNGFGQAIINSNFPVLFTPQARNQTVGTFSSITGLAGATQNVLVAITEAGTILGYSCVSQPSGGCQNQGFIWTPTTANGPSGTTAAMPLPPGFVAVTPTAINQAGSVVGTMALSSGSPVPFLYTAGTYYDLTTLSGVPVGTTPAGINQSGQILLNMSIYGGNVYLVSPVPAPAPPPAGAVTVTINSNTASQVFTVTGTGCAPGGYTTPQILQWGPGSSCTVAFVSPYSQQAGTQYVLTGWQDGSTSNPRVIVTPAQSTTYTASFKTQYQLSINVNPPAGGSVSGSGFVDAGGTVTLTATAAAGYRFVNWSGAISTTANPVSVQMYYFQTVTANFLPVTNAVLGNWSVMQIATNSTGYSINSFGQIAGVSLGSPFLWTPVAANSGVGTLMNMSNSTNLPTAAAVNDFGQVLFSQNTCCPGGPYGPAVLWTPATAQGLTGTTTTISTDSGNFTNTLNTLNNFGQVGTFVNASPSIWTPTAPNGMSGAYTANAQWQGLTAMNGFGQAIINSNFPLLFTPQARNQTVGTLSSITGLAGATQNVLVAINETGTILGYSCVAQPSGGCQNQGFIWTPTTANGPSGATAAMPLPPGFVAVTPTAINQAGSVVGTMALSSGSPVPFLYTAGTYYDLTTLSGVPVGTTPAGINQSGQILLNMSIYGGNVYLVSPVPAPAPPPAGAVTVTINSNTASQVFTVTGTGCAPGGYTTPQILQWGPGSSCTVAFVSPYSQQAGTQYVLTGWQDGSTSNPRVIVTPAQSTTYTASFKTQYQLSVNVNPPAGGSVSGGGFVDVGGTATLTATAATGYRFVNWSGSITTTANPTSVQMYNFQTVTANFLPVTNAVPGNWSVMQIATNATGWSINSFGQVAGGNVGNPFLWSPVSANSGVGTLMNLSNSTNLPTAAAVNDFGQVLFSQNTCCPGGPYGPAVLWTPATAQGLTGATTTISTESGNVTNTLNNFGQVGTFVNASPSIWTPTTPNGTSGAYTANPQWGGLTATNGFGQAIINSNFPVLFTPQARNQTVGTFSSITGLAGATQNVLVAITEAGTILGYSCVSQPSGGCQNQGFIWTPTTANGPSGTTAAMPLPPGFVAVTPTAINQAGSVVGTMALSSGSPVPFLYTAGTYYDLTTISGVPVGTTPAGINQSGQILLNMSIYGGNVYLVSPVPAPAPPNPPTVHIESPVPGSSVSGVVTVAGWAIDNASSVGTAIGSVQVSVDGVVAGNATYGVSRPDVCAAFPGRPGCPNVGFIYQLNSAVLPPGQHTITVTATDTDAAPDTTTASVTVAVAAIPPSVYIESPVAGSVLSGSVLVSGWALDNTSVIGTAISSVKVKVDGVQVGAATYGITRPDVCNAYPGRPGCPNVGFSYLLNTAPLGGGPHTITVSATDSEGTPDVGSSDVTISVANIPPSVYIDSPAPGAVLSGSVTVTGWALDNTTTIGTAISSVQVKVDGVVVGAATYGLSRADVCAAYAGRPGCPNVGFSYSLNTAMLSPGTHLLTASATDSDTNPDSGAWSISFQIAPLPNVQIDSPADGATVSGPVAVTGWAIDNTSTVGTAISSVQVSVDGLVVGNATYGVSRPDVCNAFPGRPSCPNVGFAYQLDTTSLSPGQHKITVTATNSDATPKKGVASVTVTVSAIPPTVHIEAPLPASVLSGAVAVSGWALDNGSLVGTAISNVQVLVDGVSVGYAIYGLSRPDVCNAYPGRPGCPNVGFSYQLDLSTLSPGSHTITVAATDTEGTPDVGMDSVKISVVYVPPSVYIDSPASGAVVNGVVPVSGWALDNTSTIGTAISLVQVKVDGVVVGNATYGISRTDVCAAYPGRPGCPNVGFMYFLDTTLLHPGSHLLTVSATDTDRSPDTGSWSIAIQVAAPRRRAQ